MFKRMIVMMAITAIVLCGTAHGGPVNFNLTLTNATMPTQDDFLYLLNSGGNGSASVASSGGNANLNFGTLMTT